MPQALPFIYIAVAAAAKTVTVKIIATVLITAASMYLTKRQQDAQLKRAREKGITVNIQANDEPLPVIYGAVKEVSGIVVWQTPGKVSASAREANKELLTTVVAWCEGPVKSILNVYLDEWGARSTTRWGNDPNAGTTSGVYLKASHHTGEDDQLADQMALDHVSYDSTLADQWTTNHRLRGVAYSVFGMVWNADIWQTGIPTITCEIVSRELYHPVTGAYIGSYNPAWALYDYLTNTRYGMGFVMADIDVESFTQAGAYCATSVTRPGGATPERRYTINGVLSPTDDASENIRQILTAMRGTLVTSMSGKLRLLVDKPEAVVLDFIENDCVGPLNINLDSRATRFNRVRARFIDRANNSQPDFVIVDSPDYRVNDGGELLQADIDLPMTTSRAQATDLAMLELRQSRYGAVIEFGTTLKGLRAEVGDVISLTHSSPGWTAKPFRVLRVELTGAEEVTITAREYNADAYDITAAAADEEPVGTELPNPFEVEPPSDLVLEPFRSATAQLFLLIGIRVTWTESPSSFLFGYDVEWRAVGAESWNQITMRRPEDFSQEITGLLPETTYDVRVRAYNTFGAISTWITGQATTLADDPELALSTINNDLIPDPAITDRNAWTIPGSTWRATGGPNGTPCVQMNVVPVTGSYMRAMIRPEKDWPATLTDNKYLAWLVVRRYSTDSRTISIGFQITQVDGQAAPIGYTTVSLLSYPVNRWCTVGPVTIGPFNDPLPGTSDPDNLYQPHRLTASLYYPMSPSNDAYVEIAGFYMVKVLA